MVFWRRHHKEGMTDVVPITQKLGFDNCPVSPCTENLRNANVPPFDLLPLYRQAVVPLWVSPPGKPLFWRLLLSASPVSDRNSICTDTARLDDPRGA